MKISFCLITLDEELNLGRALRSCRDLADEIVILDSGSVDATRSIAMEFGARWHQESWRGFVGQKNRVLSLASCDWVFSLDADEELSGPLRDEIRSLRQSGPGMGASGFSMPRCVRYEGRWIRHGDWYPDRLVRLFLRARARFEGGKVHERLVLDGRIRCLTGDLNHYSFRDAADHRARGEKYAELWAETRMQQGRRANPWDPALHGAFRWIRGYLLRAGFLDGPQGWRIALLNAREARLKYERLRRLGRRTG